MTTYANAAPTLNIQRYFEDDYPVELVVPVGASIAGFTFVLTIEGQCTVDGTITDPDANEISFDLANAEDLSSVAYDATELPVGNYTWFVVMTDTAGDERTVVRGMWRVSTRSP